MASMSKIFNKLMFAIIVVLFFPILAHAHYTITPVKVHIKTGSMMSSLTINNNNDDARYFQVRIYAVGDSKDHEIETKDIISSPSMFKVNGKKSQMIRVAVKNAEEAFKHKHYVLSVKEMPHGENEHNTVKFVTDFRIPVILGESEVHGSASDANEAKKGD